MKIIIISIIENNSNLQEIGLNLFPFNSEDYFTSEYLKKIILRDGPITSGGLSLNSKGAVPHSIIDENENLLKMGNNKEISKYFVKETRDGT